MMRVLPVLLIALTAASCAPRHVDEEEPPAYAAISKTPAAFMQTGMASWYGPGFAGKKTANGERFNPEDLTCAHRTLAFGTKVRVTNLENGKSVLVRVNDRGPYARKRVIDLSKEAAQRLGMLERGAVKVQIESVE